MNQKFDNMIDIRFSVVIRQNKNCYNDYWWWFFAITVTEFWISPFFYSGEKILSASQGIEIFRFKRKNSKKNRLDCYFFNLLLVLLQITCTMISLLLYCYAPYKIAYYYYYIILVESEEICHQLICGLIETVMKWVMGLIYETCQSKLF